MVLRTLTDPSESFCSEVTSTVAEKGASRTDGIKTPFTLGTISSFFGRLLAAGCCPGQVKTAKAEKRKIEARAIRKRCTLTSLRNNYHRPCSLYRNLEVR